MNYQDTLSFLFESLPMYQRIGKAAYKANLENTIALDNFDNNPHHSFKSIHVAGTNGKGSVSHMLSAIFQSSGYTTGLYTSPHLLDFRERIRINGEPIGETEVIEYVRSHLDIINTLHPSFFELTVSMAFSIFRERKVDIAIIETGLGGRLDSTNIISPLVSVITNIGLDHMQFLGSTLPEIAGEKAGIIKQDTPVIIGETQSETKAVFMEKAQKCNASIRFADQQYKSVSFKQDNFTQRVLVNAEPYDLDMTGIYQLKNLITTLATVNQLENVLPVSPDALKKGLRSVKKLTGLRGRWDVMNERPLTICETSHNELGILETVKQIEGFKAKKLHFIMGLVNDKEPASILKHLPIEAEYYFTKAQIHRALPPESLQSAAALFGLKGDVYATAKEAIENAYERAGTDDVILITGSIFLVADALYYFDAR